MQLIHQHTHSLRQNALLNFAFPARNSRSLTASAAAAAIYIFITTFYLPDTYAQSLPTPINPAIRELDIQKKQRLQEDITRELDKNRLDSQTQTPTMPPESIPDTSQNVGPTFLINTITIDTGEHADMAVKVSDILESYENRELGNTELFALIRDVTNRYAERGFSTTTISLIPKNMKLGNVELKVNWG